MKKIIRARSIRLQEVREEHNRSRALKRRLAARTRQWFIEHGEPSHPKRVIQTSGGRELVVAPKSLSLLTRTDYKALLDLVHRLRRLLRQEGKSVALDLRACINIKAAAMLKLHAELSVLRSDPAVDARLTVLWPDDNRARGALLRVGFGSGAVTTEQKPGMLPITTGVSGDGVLGKLLGHMNRSLYGGSLAVDGLEWDALHKALSEAMLNVQMHAYSMDQDIPGSTRVYEERKEFVGALGPRWWIMGETLGDQLFVALYDKGVGIPVALQHKEPRVKRVLERAARMASRSGGHDSGHIKAAMAYGRSGLKRGGQGYGLRDIRQFVEGNPRGRLYIYSNKGEYQYETTTSKVSLTEHSQSMHGTLIQWNVSLAKNRVAK